MQIRRKINKAFTLAEILTAVSIIAVLCSIGFFAMAPSREMARQAVCVSQLKQVFVVATLYASDYDEGNQYPELHGLSYIPNGSQNPTEQLKHYGFVRDFLFCPCSSPSMRKKLGSTYLWPIRINPINSNGTISDSRNRMIKWEQQMGDRLPIVECHIHDELYYAPSERAYDPALVAPYRIKLLVSGNVKKGRDYPPRTFLFTELSY